MIIIADSGSTKTDWCVIKEGVILQRIITQGINPFFQTEEEISNQILNTLLPQLNEVTEIRKIHFYGAGCAFPDKNLIVQNAISKHIKVKEEIEINSDMLAAARGLCGNNAGIVCILGTGSNSCYYNGNEIVKNVSPLGFILGDEGSGAYMGKLLVSDILKNQMPQHIIVEFLERYKLSSAEIIDKVYRKPFPNRFLAGFTPFIIEKTNETCIYNLVYGSLKAFIQRNVMQYEYKGNKVNFIGSIAFYFKDILLEVAKETGITIGVITKSPIDGLVNFHK